MAGEYVNLTFKGNDSYLCVHIDQIRMLRYTYIHVMRINKDNRMHDLLAIMF